MSEREELFCIYWVESLNGSQSAIRAGYKERTARITASKLLTKTNIKKRIDELMQERKRKEIASVDEVLTFLSSVLRGELDEEVVTQSGKKMLKKTSIKDRLKASELLGKRYALFTDKTELELKEPIIFKGDEDLED